ncbi:hypothetical protein NHX12_022322 [Muraenolepis orangiensis]|uniref:Neurotransmitter-gated ion-channel transmembrane domain-containing protein n=1 Tax=Muraenolepis orangiensis TaxID=630683 RepID=A0A9Q0IU41_9TELE|nr:hypothetical protein NHX12_022322 [Muraenolepis orangiensis]
MGYLFVCLCFVVGYNINEVMFNWTRGNESVIGLDTLKLAQYTVGNHYTSVTEAIYETGLYPQLVLHFDLKRSILSFILETYVPSCLLVVLSWVSFWISQSSVPARICIGMTTVLTMTTLMMGTRNSLPNSNCFIKAIDVYLGICFSFIFGALIEYAVVHFCTLTYTESSLSGSEPRLEAPPEKARHWCFTVLAVLRKVLHPAVNCCHIENPHYIDNYSRVIFPLSFVMVNLLYWTYYLYF